jgi:outer membrane protein OmpA-like peptidoglycan-associated protein
MNAATHVGLAGACLVIPSAMVGLWVAGAGTRLHELEAATPDTPQVAVAAAADEGYCSGDLKKILRRVLQSCGLLASGEVRGCQPLEAKSAFGTVSGADFNALFLPLSDRAGIIQFDMDSEELDPNDTALLDRVFSDQRGASYFFVVARSSPEGSDVHNRELSQRRGESVLAHLKQTFNDPDLDTEVGLLWLGEEYAQLDQEFCTWQRSGAAESCQPQDLNRSAFVAWIDCRL